MDWTNMMDLTQLNDQIVLITGATGLIGKTIVKMLLECAQTYADINHQTIILIIKIVAITAAPATERYKIKH